MTAFFVMSILREAQNVTHPALNRQALIGCGMYNEIYRWLNTPITAHFSVLFKCSTSVEVSDKSQTTSVAKSYVSLQQLHS